ncbi:unnamed protein product [Prunus armeniaca]
MWDVTLQEGFIAEHDLYRELTIAPSQTLVEVFATEEHYVLLDDDQIAAKKSPKQVDPSLKKAS